MGRHFLWAWGPTNERKENEDHDDDDDDGVTAREREQLYLFCCFFLSSGRSESIRLFCLLITHNLLPHTHRLLPTYLLPAY
jgi:hypothetical protein